MATWAHVIRACSRVLPWWLQPESREHRRRELRAREQEQRQRQREQRLREIANRVTAVEQQLSVLQRQELP